MPINPMYFQILSPEQANPLGYGLMQGQQIAGQGAENIGRNIQNALMSAQVPYAGQTAQADLALKQAQVPYLESQTALNTGTLPYLGMKFAAPMLGAQARMMQAGANWSNNFRQWVGTPEGQLWVKNNPDAAQSVLNSLNASANINNSGFGLNMPSNIPTTINGNYNNPASLPVLPGGNPNMPNEANNQNGMTITPQQQAQLKNLIQPGIPNAVSQIQQAAADNYATKMMTPQQRQQVMYGNVVDGLLRDNQNTINDAIQFAGAAGKASQFADKYAQSAGLSNSPQYRNYAVFTNQIAPKIANELRRAYGGQATDYEAKLMKDIGDPITWNKDPQQASMEFNQLVNDLRTNTRAITQTPSQSLQTAQTNAATPLNFNANTNNSRVRVVSPDGKSGTIPADQLQSALKAGYKQG